MYVRLTAQNSPLLVGGQLSAMRFYLSDKTGVKSARVWLSSNPSGTPLLSQDVATDELRDLTHDGAPTVVRLSEAVSVLPATNPYASIYVGFTLELQGTPVNYMIAGDCEGVPYSNFYNGMDVASGYGALALQVQVSGPRIPERSVSIQTPDEQIAVCNAASTVIVPLENGGSDVLQSVGYVVYVDGEAQDECTYNLPQPLEELGMGFELPADYTAPSQAEQHELSVQVTSLNGQSLTADEPVLTGNVPLIVLDRPTTRRTVMEEFTGTWCLNCVRGILGIQRLQAQYGDRFIPIALHGDDRDPMMLSDYYYSSFFREKMKILGGYPSCSIDRRYDCDPYCGWMASGPYGTDAIVGEALSLPTVADISLTANWTDDTQTAIVYHVSTRFGYSSDDAHYALVLVLTADGMKGEGRYWQQSNGYNDYTGTDEGLRTLAGLGAYLPNSEFNHVAIAVAGVDGGIDGSVISPLLAGETQQFNYTLSVSDNKLIQDPQRLNAIALLLDTRDGTVANAAQTPVGNVETGIHAATAIPLADDTPVYDLQGRRLYQPRQHGLYIMGGRKVVR